MNPEQESVSPPTADSPPPPRPVAVPEPHAPHGPPVRPTADAVLRWIAAARPEPWFPSAHAKQTGTPRDSLDEPLNELRVTGLVYAAAWVRGTGQGYVLTPEGEAATADPAVLGLLRDLAPHDEPTGEPPLDLDLGPRSVIDLRQPLVTPVVLAANLIWFFVGLVIAMRTGVGAGPYLSPGDTGVLARLGAVSPLDLLRGDWWRLASCCFVHVGVLHLIGNMFVLGMIGPLAELIWGRWRLAVVYALSGLAGSCLAMALHPLDDRGVPVMLAGASGAIWGIQTSLAAWLLLFHPYLPPELTTDWMRRLGIMFLLNAAVSFLPGVSWEAHLGGGVVGFVSAGLLNALRFGNGSRRLTAALLLLALPVLCGGGLVAAMREGDAWATIRHRLAAQEAARHAEAFNREIGPLLEAIRPDAARPVENEAGGVLLRNPTRRAALQPGARAKVEQFRAAAADLAEQLSGPPTGFDVVDRQREKVQAYAAARARSLELLLGMLDRPEIPPAAAWKAWGESRREADRCWNEIGKNKRTSRCTSMT